ncbi:MAG: hypothetical protein QW582_02040 [Candidatus Micrarchaeaceae archaeon]
MQNLIEYIKHSLVHKNANIYKSDSKEVMVVKVADDVWQFIWAKDYKDWKQAHKPKNFNNN